jgi:chorismate dehydratase
MDHTCTVHLTNDSASSVRLLYLLLVKMLGVDYLPKQSENKDAVNGELLIGDQALKQAVSIKGWGRVDSYSDNSKKERLSIVTDLASVWQKNYGLPFVFARWVVRKDAPTEVKEILFDWLEAFRKQESEMVQACIKPTARMLDVDASMAKRYFEVIQRCLDDTHIQGQKQFISEFEKVKREPLFNWI